MKLNGYHIINELIEMSLKKTLSRGSKIIGRNISHDPFSLAVTVIPGSGIAGPLLHLTKNKRSRDVGRVMWRKILNPKKWKK